MTTQYTPTLKLALPVTGELSGTWGDVVNDNITSMIEQAIAGLSTINTWTANAHTLTTANGTTSESRCAMLVAATGAGGTALTGVGEIICPSAAKLYVVQNTTAFVVTLKTSAGTGVAVAAGDTAFLFCDATNVNSCVTTIVNGNITGNLTVGGNATINGNTTLGNATSDTITATARFNTDLVPSTDNARDLGSAANSWRSLWIDGTATMALVAITGGTIDGVSIGSTTAATIINVDNLRLDGNTLSSTDTNGNVVIAPNGTGDVQLDADTVRVGDAAAAATLTSNGAGALTVTTGGTADLTLSTNAGVNSGTVVIANGVNGNITLTPNGTGDVILSADRVQMGDSNTDTTLTTNGTGNLNLTTNDGTNSGTIQIAQGINGNITLTPNGTGSVSVPKLVWSNGTTTRVLYLTTGGQFTDSANLTFNGTTLTAGGLTTTGTTSTGVLSVTGNTTLGDAAADTVTVTGTITSNLLFTDATYDIGASGATRPRDLFLSRNLTVGGTLTLTGGVNLNGNVTVGDASTDTLTINSTITSNLIFTDNTYDIGASGATRPRNLYLAGTATIGGNTAITGTLSATGNTTIGAGSGSPQLKLSGAASSTANSGAQLAFAAAGTPYAYISNVAWIKGGGSTDNNLAYWTDAGLGHYFYANNNATTAVAAITSTGLAVAPGVLTLGTDLIYDAFINSPESMFFNVDSDANSSNQSFIFGTDRAGTTGGTEFMRISGATGGVGAVGIGYSSLTSVGNNGLAVLGNVGIGTSSPSQKLVVRDVNKIVDGIGNVFFATTDSQAADLGAILSLGGTYVGTSAYSFAAIAGKKTNSTSTDASGYLAMYTTNPSNTIVERARIDSSGNLLVGINSAMNGIGSDGKIGLQLSGSVGNFVVQNSADNNFYLAKINGYTNSTFMVFSVNGTNAGNITTNGTSLQLDKISAITFPATQVASANANTLDDYEEGTWTPGIAFDGASTGVTYDASYNRGWYTRVGRLVTCTMALEVTSKGSSTGVATITGFPFSSTLGDASVSHCVTANYITVTSGPLSAYGTLFTGVLSLVRQVSGSSQIAITNSDCASSFSVLATIVYLV